MISPDETKLFAGKYRILRRLSGGGFGTVYLAHQQDLDREIALKIMNVGTTDSQTRARFEREAKALDNFRHKNIVAFFGFGLEDSVAYIAMEYIDGIDLQTLISREKALSLQRTLHIALQITDALEAAHEARIIHRDLKPSNVMVSGAQLENVKLIDFGLARLFDPPADGQKITLTGACVGTVQYMSPEQCLNEPIDERSDLYSLGCMLYHAIAGRAPFASDNPMIVMHQHIYDKPSPLAAVGQTSAELSAFETIIAKCLAKAPQDRYSSASALSQDLHELKELLVGKNEVLATTIPAIPQSHERVHVPKNALLIRTLAILVSMIAVFATISFYQSSLRASYTRLPADIAEMERAAKANTLTGDVSKLSAMLRRVDSYSAQFVSNPHLSPEMAIRLLELNADLCLKLNLFMERAESKSTAMRIRTEFRMVDDKFAEAAADCVQAHIELGHPRSAYDTAVYLIKVCESNTPPVPCDRLRALVLKVRPRLNDQQEIYNDLVNDHVLGKGNMQKRN